MTIIYLLLFTCITLVIVTVVDTIVWYRNYKKINKLSSELIDFKNRYYKTNNDFIERIDSMDRNIIDMENDIENIKKHQPTINNKNYSTYVRNTETQINNLSADNKQIHKAINYLTKLTRDLRKAIRH